MYGPINNFFARAVESTKQPFDAEAAFRRAYDLHLTRFLAALDKASEEHYAKHYPNLKSDVHSLERGPKYIRVVSTHRHANGAQSNDRRVYCFLDRAGNIYKAESWKKPHPKIRGSILNDPNFSIGKGLTHHGAVYLR